MNWDLINTIIQLISTIAVLVALIYAWQQIKEARKQSYLSALWEIYQELSSEETRLSREYVYKNRHLYQNVIDLNSLNRLPIEARENAYKVCNTFDRIGFVIYQDLIPYKLVLDAYFYVVARSWVALEPFIQNIRKARAEESYQQFFEHLSKIVFSNYLSQERVSFTGEALVGHSLTSVRVRRRGKGKYQKLGRFSWAGQHKQ